MKPMVIVVVLFVTVSVFGIATIQVHYAEPQQAPKAPAALSFTENQSVDTGLASIEQLEPETASFTPSQDLPQPEVDSLRLISLTERRVGSTDNQEKWTWRVDVENPNSRAQFCFVEVEWLDGTGACLESAAEVRRIEPGTHSISMVHAMDWETADQATTVRVTRLETRPAPNDE